MCTRSATAAARSCTAPPPRAGHPPDVQHIYDEPEWVDDHRAEPDEPFASDAGDGSARRPLTREDVLGVRDVAALLGLPRSTVHDLARRGLLPARRVGRRWLFVRERVEAALIPLEDATAWRPGTQNRDHRGNGRPDS